MSQNCDPRVYEPPMPAGQRVAAAHGTAGSVVERPLQPVLPDRPPIVVGLRHDARVVAQIRLGS